MLNFKELKDNTAELAQRKTTAYKTKIGVWLNLSQDFLFNLYDYYTELQETHNFTTVDDTENYAMPNNFDKPLRIFDLTNNTRLEIKTEVEYFDSNISNIANSTTGKPSKARIYGTRGVTTPISTSGDTVQVKSSSVSDIGSIVVRVEGYLDSARLVTGYEDITISTSSSTTFVAGTITFYEILHISKSADTIGYITIANSSDETLVLMSPTDRVSRRKIMKLGLIPNDSYSMRTLFKKRHNKMVNDNDYPFLEADDFLMLDAWGWALSQEKETADKAATVWNKAQQSLNAIFNNQIGKYGPDFQHKITSQFALAHRIRT